MTVGGTLLVQLDATPTDPAVRQLRQEVGNALESKSLKGVVVDLRSVDAMDSYVTRCIRDLAVGARLMGVPTVVCGVQPAVADTLIEMGLDLGDVPTVLNIDVALRLLSKSRAAAR